MVQGKDRELFPLVNPRNINATKEQELLYAGSRTDSKLQEAPSPYFGTATPAQPPTAGYTQATAASTSMVPKKANMLGQSLKLDRAAVEIQGFEDQLKQIQDGQEVNNDYSHDIAFKVGRKGEFFKRRLSFEEDAIDDVYNF